MNYNVKTGRVLINEDIVLNKPGQLHHICPGGGPGGRDWAAGAYSPITDAMYFPLNNACFDEGKLDIEKYTPDLGMARVSRNRLPTSDSNRQVCRIEAISVSTGKTLWKYEQRAGTHTHTATYYRRRSSLWGAI